MRQGKDTIYVHAGTYGLVQLSNLWPSDTVLITNAPGESPVIEGWAASPTSARSSACGG